MNPAAYSGGRDPNGWLTVPSLCGKSGQAHCQGHWYGNWERHISCVVSVQLYPPRRLWHPIGPDTRADVPSSARSPFAPPELTPGGFTVDGINVASSRVTNLHVPTRTAFLRTGSGSLKSRQRSEGSRGRPTPSTTLKAMGGRMCYCGRECSPSLTYFQSPPVWGHVPPNFSVQRDCGDERD